MSEAEEKLMELRVQLLELELARQRSPKTKEHFWTSPAILAILGAVCTASFGLVANKNQLDASRQLERDKLESSLILKAVDSSDPAQRISALKFLVKAGLISDNNGTIEKLTVDDVPQIKNPVVQSGSASAPVSITDLVDQVNATIKDIRISAVEKLIKTHSTNAIAVEAALGYLESEKLDNISAAGRVNLLVFLRNTNEVAWSSESIARAEKIIVVLRQRNYGSTTQEGIDKLITLLDKLKSQSNARGS